MNIFFSTLFSLDINNKTQMLINNSTNIFNLGSDLYNNKDFSDIQIISNDKRIFYCQKIILAYSCPFFKMMLTKYEKNKNEIKMDFSEKAIETFLLTIYKKKFVVEKVDDLFECLELANFLGNENFENECLEYFTLEFIKENDQRKKAMKVLLSLEIQNEKVNHRIAELASGKNDNIFNLYDEMGNVTRKMNFLCNTNYDSRRYFYDDKLFQNLSKKVQKYRKNIYMVPNNNTPYIYSNGNITFTIYFDPCEEKEMLKKYPCLKNIYKKIFKEELKYKNIYSVHTEIDSYGSQLCYFNRSNTTISSLIMIFNEISQGKFNQEINQHSYPQLFYSKGN